MSTDNTPTTATTADRNLAMHVLLDHVYANMDVLSLFAATEGSDLEELAKDTLYNFLHGSMEKVERVRDFIDSLPCAADDILLQAIRDAQWRARDEGRPDYQQRYEAVLKRLAEAHEELESLRCRRPIGENDHD